MHRDRRLRQGGLRADRVPERAQDTGAGLERRNRSADQRAGRHRDRRPSWFFGFRGPVRSLLPAAGICGGPENPGQQLHRAHVRQARSGPVSFGCDPRLHRQGKGLLRRRAALQHQLHPVLRHRHGHRQSFRRSKSTCSKTAPYPWPVCSTPWERISKEKRRCVCG